MLEARPPATADTSLRVGDKGWAVYGLQCAINYLWQTGLAADGDFGLQTDAAVTGAQNELGLFVDGIAGPATQGKMIRKITGRVKLAGIPDGLARGMNEGEGGPYFGAVNWAVEGGVDCGIVQHRVTEPYSLARLELAFHPSKSLVSSLRTLLERADGFKMSTWAKVSRERQLRCAIMAHNWPAGAATIAATGTCSQPSAVASWVPRGVKFPDGAAVVTRREWCEFYAMGGPHGPAKIPRYVTSWT